MPRKAKKKVHSMPKLGFVDRMIYWILMILGFAGSIGCIFGPIIHRHLLAKGNPDALCFDNGTGLGFSFWLAFWLLLVTLIGYERLYARRIPIFGRHDIRYGPPAYPRIYPLMMKEKPKFWESPKQIRKRRLKFRICAAALVLTFLFSTIMFSFSFCSRHELLRDGTVMAYDYQNQPTHYDLEELESVRLFVNSSSTRGGRTRWYPSFELRFKDGTRCVFNVRTFADDWIPALQVAQGLKAYYGELLVIHGTEKLEKVTLNQSMTAMESKLLYALFETKMP